MPNICKEARMNIKHKNWFKSKPQLPTRQIQDKYFKPIARTGRLMNTTISYKTTQSKCKQVNRTVKSFKVNYSSRRRMLLASDLCFMLLITWTINLFVLLL